MTDIGAGATSASGSPADDVTFDAAADSVAAARRLVARQLARWDLAALADDARLVVSELLTNATLHAQPPIQLRLVRMPQGVRIEIRDGSRELPLTVRPGADTMTGRGWMLVRALSSSFGVEPLADGKRVWVTLGGAPADPNASEGSEGSAAAKGSAGSEGSGAADGDALATSTIEAALYALNEPDDTAPDVERYEVALGDVPTDLLIAAKAQIDAVIREFALLASAAAGGHPPVPAALHELIQRVVGNFGAARQSIKKQALEAAQVDRPRTRLTLTLPLAAADAGLDYLAALEEVDAYCRAERMLTLETPPAHRVFRRWYVEQLVAGLRHAAAHEQTRWQAEPFESYLLREYDRLSLAYAELSRMQPAAR